MKLIIFDHRRLVSYPLPEDSQGFFMVNYDSLEDSISEKITLQKIDGYWNAIGNRNVLISFNNTALEKAVLETYAIYTIFFSIYNIEIKLVCVPDNEALEYFYFGEQLPLTIGNASCSINCALPTFLPNESAISKEDGIYYIYNSNEKSNIYINDVKLKVQKIPIKFGDVLFIDGLKIVWFETYMAINNPKGAVSFGQNMERFNFNVSNANEYSQTTESERNIKLYTDNDVFFHTPKIKSYIKSEEINIDPPPDNYNTEKVPIILTIGSSAVIGLTSCISGFSAFNGLRNGSMDKATAYEQLITCALMLVACFFLPVITDIWQKRRIKKKEQERIDKYTAYLDKNKAFIQETIKTQETILKEKHLTLDEIANESKSKGYNMWSREVVDKDFLSVRLGMGNMPAFIEVNGEGEKFSLHTDELKEKAKKLANEERLLTNVPITISMVENRITPIVVQTEKYKEYIDAVLLQLLFYYSPIDLKLVVFTNENGNNYFDFLKYSNHCWSKERDMRFFASNDAEANQLSMYLEHEYTKRFNDNNDEKRNNKDASNGEEYKAYNEYYLIITDDFKSFKDVSIINKVINSGINVGFSLLVFSNSLKNLPSRLEKFIVIENGQSGIYSKNFDNSFLGKFNAEYLDKYDINELTFNLFNIPLPQEGSESTIPKSINFLDLYNVGKVEHLNVSSRWQNNVPTTTLNAPIGLQANNKLIGLDLHEKAHGPHGLIAGSTGSGKSEFIITYILSMAVNYHPYEVQFVLIDYKGGGLAGAFESREKGIKIPHLIGTITNLDKSEMNRTLVSIKSELERRQVKFNEAREALGEGTIDIYKYQRLFREGKVKEPISHLFIVSDEFAELKQQQPEFMDELVSTARIGRSLGVHLILATQKPSGVVNDQIWSNSRFKVCLKVQTSEDSFEVLKKDDASKIKETGRFYLQVGNDEIFELGQSAWAGDKYYPSEVVLPKINDSIDFISNDGTIIKSINDDIKQNGVNHGEQLQNIVKHLYDLAKSSNINFSSLWLPSIPSEIFLGNIIKKYDYKPKPFYTDAIIGEYDKPARQMQGLFKIPLNSNTLLFGSGGSGKENLIATLIYSSCLLHTPQEINFYIADFGAETLSMFNKMPHVGSFITSDEPTKVEALFVYLEKQIQKRKNLFSEYQGNYWNYCSKSGKSVPLIVTIINSYEGFKENCEAYDDYLIHLLREGNKYGILFVVSSISTNSVRSSLLEFFKNKMVLQTQDSYDYQYILNSHSGFVPSPFFGRGITVVDDEPCEFQTAFICNRDDIVDAVREASKKLIEYYKMKAPDIKVMPKSATFDDLKNHVKLVNNFPLGYTLENADLVNYDFTKRKITTVLGENTTDNNTFMFTVIDLLDNIKNIKLNIFDISSSINTDGNAKYYNSDFAYPFSEVLETTPETIQINIIIGIGFAKELLSEEENNMLIQMLTRADDNNYYIIFDNYDRFEELKDTQLYSIVDRNNGIWYGGSIDFQTFFNINNLAESDVESRAENKIYYISNSDYVLLKGIGYTGEDY